MHTIVSRCEEDTRRLGARVGALLRAGDVVLLTGDLGAGKSVMARGIASGMGVTGPMPSPTFTLMTSYTAAQGMLYHLDLYRLEDAQAYWDSGLDEWVGGDGVALVEWPERAEEMLPARHLRVSLTYGEQEGERHIALTPCGGFALAMPGMGEKSV